MGNLRLYRDIYKIDISSVTGETYSLTDPFSIDASSFERNSTAVTESLSVSQESSGIYYVELNPVLYTFTDIYEVRWLVQYVSDSSSLRTLTTRFRLEPFNITGDPIIVIVDNSVFI
jgi:hypothetical protein